MILFTIYDLFTVNIYDGNGIKTPKYIQTKTKEEIPRLVALPSTKMEADCFPVSENTENKPNLPYVGWGPESCGGKNRGLGMVWAVKLQ